MPDFDKATYREREKCWREQASALPPGPEREACTALADGYLNLLTILERLDQESRQQVQPPAMQ